MADANDSKGKIAGLFRFKERRLGVCVAKACEGLCAESVFLLLAEAVMRQGLGDAFGRKTGNGLPAMMERTPCSESCS